MKNHETTLPEGYREIKHINALDKKLGLILNLVAVLVLAAVAAIACIPVFLGSSELKYDSVVSLLVTGVFLAGCIVYIVLHELVHGIAYKALTHEKLTFGFTWSCAYCGVPNIYVYRRASLIALVAPLITFTLILIPVTVALYFVSLPFYFASAMLLGMHLGGCSGDIYMTLLLLFKYRDPALLVRDTGPEQYLYLKESES